MSTSNFHERPYGVGLAYRFSVHRESIQHKDEIDLLELSTEDYIVRERRIYSDPDEAYLREALATIPCVAHGLSLSIGTVEPLNEAYLNGTKEFMTEHDLNVFSEHLAYHRIDGNDLTMFLAMPFEEAAVQWVKQNYYATRRKIGRPFALENVTYHFPVSNCSMREQDFLRRITEETDCSLLLDITNVFNNSENHSYDALEFFDSIPMDRVSQMHLAGGHQQPDGKWEDSHSEPVMPGVWPLFDEAVRRAENLEIVILERDSKLRPFDSVLADIRKAREIFYKHKPETPPERSPIVMGEDPLQGEPDFESSEFADLRAYQRSMMARITSDEFRKEFQENPAAATARFGLTDPEWIRRLTDSDGKSMWHFQESWDYFKEDDKQVEEDYKKREWAMWAKQMGG